MEILLNGISIVTIAGVFYKTINLFLAKKTDTIFFTESKKIVRDTINYVGMLMVMSVSIYIFPLQFNNRVPNNIVMTIAGAFLSIVVLTIMVANIINQFKSNKIKKFLKPFYTNGLVWVIIFVLE